MLSSSCSYSAFRRSFFPLSTTPSNGFAGRSALHPISRSFHILQWHSRPQINFIEGYIPDVMNTVDVDYFSILYFLLLPGVAKAKHWNKPSRDVVITMKFKVLCFRHEDHSSETPKPEFIDRYLPEELAQSESNHSNAAKRDWKSSFQIVINALFRVIGYEWVVPWTAETILQVTLLWIVAFWFIGSWIIPVAAHIAGFSKESMTFRGQALFSLITDVTEGVAGIAILHRCLSRFYPLPPDWFKFSLRGNWQLDVMAGCLMFPLVNRLSQFNLDLLLPLLPSTPVTLSSVEQSILARDPVAMILYAIVVSVCAPVWEEIVFRGFLLPSLTKYMPVWCAILVSSVAFALAHFNMQRMLPLIFLGMVMGVLFTRSRNLLPSMLLHSLWNGFVFLELMR